MSILYRILIFPCLLFTTFSFAQSGNAQNEGILISAETGFWQPGGYLERDFGYHFNLALSVSKKFKSDYTLGLRAQYLFGNQVKNPATLLSPVLTEKGYVLNTTGNYADVNLYERGLGFSLEASRIITGFLSPNRNSGPTLFAGGGYLFHWLMLDNIGNDSPQILDEYRKGYDQLNGGLSLSQGLGYTYLSDNRRINFHLSLVIQEYWSGNLRGYNYATGRAESGQNFSFWYGIRAGWILPIYKKSANPYYFN